MGLSHLPVRLSNISEVDRKTFRKWARISYSCYFCLIVGLLVIGFWTRGTQDLVVTKKEAAGTAGSIARPAGHRHPGG
jgi:hypothetical protein